MINFCASGFQQWGISLTSASKCAFIAGFDLFLTPVFSLLGEKRREEERRGEERRGEERTEEEEKEKEVERMRKKRRGEERRGEEKKEDKRGEGGGK